MLSLLKIMKSINNKSTCKSTCMSTLYRHVCRLISIKSTPTVRNLVAGVDLIFVTLYATINYEGAKERKKDKERLGGIISPPSHRKGYSDGSIINGPKGA